MTNPVPIGRAIIDRKTGNIVGGVSEVFSEDIPYKAISLSEKLWRYMDYFKFEDLLKTSSLYFARPDKFPDPYEGRLSPGNKISVSKSDMAFRNLYNISNLEESEKYHDIHRNVVFILCWHRNNKEDWRMWNAYTDGSAESVAITTSVKSLSQFMPPNVKGSPVKYHALDFPRTEFDHSSLFFYKPEDFGFESEFRLLRQPEQNESFESWNPNDEFRRVPVRLNKIIHRVVLHPKSNQAFRDRVSKLMGIHLKGVSPEKSSLG